MPPRSPGIHPRLAVEKADAVDADEMQAEPHHQNARDGVEPALVLQEGRADGRGGKAKKQKYRRQAQHEEQRRNGGPGALRAAGGEVVQRHPAHIGQIGRHDRQHAGAEERDYPRQQRHDHGGQKACVDDFYTEHFFHIINSFGRVTPTLVTTLWTGRDRALMSRPWTMIEIDARGMLCPLPVLKLAKRIKALEAGDQVRLMADDPAAVVDVPHYCRETGHALISVSEAAGHQVYLIRK